MGRGGEEERGSTDEVVPRGRVVAELQGLVYARQEVVCQVWLELAQLVEVVVDGLRREPTDEVEGGREGFVGCRCEGQWVGLCGLESVHGSHMAAEVRGGERER